MEGAETVLRYFQGFSDAAQIQRSDIGRYIAGAGKAQSRYRKGADLAVGHRELQRSCKESIAKGAQREGSVQKCRLSRTRQMSNSGLSRRRGAALVVFKK